MDTGNDPRLLLVEHGVRHVADLFKQGRLKGQLPKAKVLSTLEQMNGAIMTVKYAYQGPDELRQMDEFKTLVQAARDVQDLLGGEQWWKTITQDELPVATVRWFLENVQTLPQRLDLPQEPDSAVDIVAGRVISAQPHEGADNLLLTRVGVGDRVLRVITNDTGTKAEDRVAVALLPPADLRGVVSEGMFLGAGKGILKDVGAEAGTRPDVPEAALAETRSMVLRWIGQ